MLIIAGGSHSVDLLIAIVVRLQSSLFLRANARHQRWEFKPIVITCEKSTLISVNSQVWEGYESGTARFAFSFLWGRPREMDIPQVPGQDLDRCDHQWLASLQWRYSGCENSQPVRMRSIHGVSRDTRPANTGMHLIPNACCEPSRAVNDEAESAGAGPVHRGTCRRAETLRNYICRSKRYKSRMQVMWMRRNACVCTAAQLSSLSSRNNSILAHEIVDRWVSPMKDQLLWTQTSNGIEDWSCNNKIDDDDDENSQCKSSQQQM